MQQKQGAVVDTTRMQGYVVEDSALAARIAVAFAALPSQQRAIFEAASVDNASYIDVAARLGISVEDVEREFAAALVALAKAADQ